MVIGKTSYWSAYSNTLSICPILKIPVLCLVGQVERPIEVVAMIILVLLVNSQGQFSTFHCRYDVSHRVVGFFKTNFTRLRKSLSTPNFLGICIINRYYIFIYCKKPGHDTLYFWYISGFWQLIFFRIFVTIFRREVCLNFFFLGILMIIFGIHIILYA